MLKLYTVNVWHGSEPRHFETIAVWTYSAQRAEHLASESYPGCNAHVTLEERAHAGVAVTRRDWTRQVTPGDY